MLIIVAPGQGAQTPGFLTPWLEDPQFAEALLNLGHALMAMGQEDEARSYWRKAIRESFEDIRDRLKGTAADNAAVVIAKLMSDPRPAPSSW